MATLSPIEIYKLLPKTNCKKCGEDTCMAFAIKLANRETSIKECPLLLEEEYRDSYSKLSEILKPPVKEVVIGYGENAVKIGGKLVLYRHEYRYDNPTAIAVDVSDDMDDKGLVDRIRKIEDISYVYIGQKLKLDLIAVRCVSGDADKFKSKVKKTAETSNLPLILCSLSPEIMEAGLSVLKGKRPLIYAATKENWADMAELALKYNCPLAVYAPNDIKLLRSLSKALIEYGVKDLVLDPGTFAGDGLLLTINNLTMCRKAAIRKKDELLGFPLMATPIVAWASKSEDAMWEEAYMTSIMILRYVDLLIIHSLEGWVHLPNLMLRTNIYTDPRKPAAVEPKLYIIGNPDRNSPVLVTSNFALTYFTVRNDLESNKISCYLIVIDTEGLSVESSVAGRKFTAEKVAKAIKETNVASLVDHRKLIISGKAARLSGEIEELTGWEVLVGPMDSADIPKFLSEKWK